MGIAIRLNIAERIRRALEAKPDATPEELAASRGVSGSQGKAGLGYGCLLGSRKSVCQELCPFLGRTSPADLQRPCTSGAT